MLLQTHVTCELELCSLSAAISSSVEGSSSLTAYSHSASRKGADPFVAGWDFVGLTQGLDIGSGAFYCSSRATAPAAWHLLALSRPLLNIAYILLHRPCAGPHWLRWYLALSRPSCICAVLALCWPLLNIFAEIGLGTSIRQPLVLGLHRLR